MPISSLLQVALSIVAIQGTDGVVFRQPQLARDGARVYLTMGAGNAVYFAGSNDGGVTFAKPVRIAEAGKLMLGRHRGPRIADCMRAESRAFTCNWSFLASRPPRGTPLGRRLAGGAAKGPGRG